MLAVSAEFLEALRYPHQLAVQVDVYAPGSTVPTISGLPVTDGAVTIDRTAERRRSLDLQLAPRLPDTGQALYPARNSDPLNVYGSVLVVKAGLMLNDQTTELIQIGRFRVDAIDRELPFGSIAVTGVDRSAQMTDERFIAPRKFSAQTALALLTLLVREVFPTCVIIDNSNGDAAGTTIPAHAVDSDRWPEVLRVGQVIGCEVFFDEQGRFVIQPVPDPQSAAAVWQVDAGETGVLVRTTDGVSRDGAPNAIIARGETTASGSAPVHSVTPHGFDLAANSPTLYGGPYGKVPLFYSSPLLRTQAQANKAADSMLADHLGASRSISFEAIPNPALDAGDAVTVTYPDGTAEKHILDTLTIPLVPTSAMSAETRAADLGALA